MERIESLLTSERNNRVSLAGLVGEAVLLAPIWPCISECSHLIAIYHNGYHSSPFRASGVMMCLWLWFRFRPLDT